MPTSEQHLAAHDIHDDALGADAAWEHVDVRELPGYAEAEDAHHAWLEEEGLAGTGWEEPNVFEQRARFQRQVDDKLCQLMLAGEVSYRTRRIIELRHQGYTLTEAAEHFDISRGTARQLEKDYLKQIGAVSAGQIYPAFLTELRRESAPGSVREADYRVCEGRHCRASGAKSVRVRGSRRCGQRARSPGGSDDPGGEHDVDAVTRLGGRR